MHRRIAQLVYAGCATLLAFQVFSALVAIPMGADNRNVVGAFDTDEMLGLNMMKRNLAERNLSPSGIYEHGSVYQIVAYYLLQLYSRAFGYELLDRTIILVMRLLSLAAFVALLYACYRILRSLHEEPVVAILGTLCIARPPNLFYYAQGIHPDLFQAALAAAAMLIVMRSATASAAFWASALAGTAAAAKWGATMLVPFLPLSTVLDSLAGGKASLNRRVLFRATAIFAACLVIAAVAFFAWSPYNVLEFSAFAQRFQHLRQVVGTGWGKKEPWNPLLWWRVFADQLGAIECFLLGTGLCWALVEIWRAVRKDGPAVLSASRPHNLILLGSYIALSSAYCLLTVRMREFRYIFHIYPFGIVLALSGLFYASPARRPIARSALIVVLFVVFAASTVGTIRRLRTAANRVVGPRVVAGEWIAEHYPTSTPIVGDWYTYQPPTLTHYKMEFVGPSIGRYLEVRDVALLVLSQDGIGRFVWKQEGKPFTAREWNVDPSYVESEGIARALKRYTEPDSPWKVVYENSEVIIFARK